MAHVTMPDGREVEIPDGRPELVAYYRGEGATVEEPDSAASLPHVFNGGETEEAEGELEHHEGELHIEGDGVLQAEPSADGPSLDLH